MEPVITNICFTPSNAGEKFVIGVMNSNIEISDMRMTTCVQKDIIRFNVAVYDFLLVKKSQCAGNLCNI